MDKNTTIIRNPELLSADMDGETVMMDMVSGKYFGINEVGAHIWRFIEVEQNIQSILDSINAEFDVHEEDDLSAGLLEFLSDMKENKLIETRDALG